ncbi:MAG: hypothetical protein AAB262_12120 [Elusimicrobiota bacterium]
MSHRDNGALESFEETCDGFTVHCALLPEDYFDLAEFDWFGTLTVREGGQHDRYGRRDNRPSPIAVVISPGDRRESYWFTPDEGWDHAWQVKRIMGERGIDHNAAQKLAAEELRRMGRLLIGDTGAACWVRVTAHTAGGEEVGTDSLSGMLIEYCDMERELRSTVAEYSMIETALDQARAWRDSRCTRCHGSGCEDSAEGASC